MKRILNLPEKYMQSRRSLIDRRKMRAGRFLSVKYNSSAGFGAGTLNMVRLSTLMDIPCEE